MPKQCLVLGGCGFMGSNLVEELLKAGYRVRVFDTPAASRTNLASVEARIEFCGGDFLNAQDLDAALREIDFVFHLVGTTLPADSNSRPSFDLQSNVIGTVGLLEACVPHRGERSTESPGKSPSLRITPQIRCVRMESPS